MFDICIVGGGMIGAAAALGLGKQGYKVVLLEQSVPPPFEQGQEPDIRVSALSLATEELLGALGVWQGLSEMRLCPYRRLSVWEDPRCRTDFNSADIDGTHIGHIVENRLLQLALHEQLENNANVTMICPANITKIKTVTQPSVSLADGQVLQARILIGADGANSRVRLAANIGSQGWQYSQHALGILISTDEPQQDITWQQFTPHGPMAFLPLHDGYGSLVWYHQAEQVRYLKSLSTAGLKAKIVQEFPNELMDFEILKVASFPITRMHANQYVKGSTVLIGDAAHSINPLAGQGVNLGFKDVKVLLQCLGEQNQQDLAPLLAAYEKARRKDNLLMMSAMDLIYTGFSNSFGPVKALRNLGLKLANRSGPLKLKVMKYAMGM